VFVINKKRQAKTCFLLRKDYKKDIFTVFAYEFELSLFLMKSFANAHGEIKGSRLW